MTNKTPKRQKMARFNPNVIRESTGEKQTPQASILCTNKLRSFYGIVTLNNRQQQDRKKKYSR